MSFRERQQREGYFDASTQGASSCFRVFCCAYGDDGFRRERFALTQKGPVKGRDFVRLLSCPGAVVIQCITIDPAICEHRPCKRPACICPQNYRLGRAKYSGCALSLARPHLHCLRVRLLLGGCCIQFHPTSTCLQLLDLNRPGIDVCY
jgi:hypothetical protein